MKKAISFLKKIIQIITLRVYQHVLDRRLIIVPPPFHVDLEVAHTCMFRCQHCDIWKRKPLIKHISLEQQKTIIDTLSNWLPTGSEMSFSGGEPFINPNTLPLIAYAHTKGFITSLTTNAFLINQVLADRICKAGLNSIVISIDFPKANLHDESRGKPGAFDKAVQAIKMLKQSSAESGHNLNICIDTIIMQSNLHLLPTLVKTLSQFRVDCINFQPICENFDTSQPNLKWYLTSPLWPNNCQHVIRVMDELISLKNQGYPIGNSKQQLDQYKTYFTQHSSFTQKTTCLAGSSNLQIDLEGTAWLCYKFKPLGNMLTDDISEMWNNLSAQHTRQHIYSCQESCKALLCNVSSYMKLNQIIPRLRYLLINHS